MKKKTWLIILAVVLTAVVAILVNNNKGSSKIESAQTTSEPQSTVEPIATPVPETETEVAEIPEVDAEGNAVSQNIGETYEFSAGGDPIPEVSPIGNSGTSGEYVPGENELPMIPMVSED